MGGYLTTGIPCGRTGSADVLVVRGRVLPRRNHHLQPAPTLHTGLQREGGAAVTAIVLFSGGIGSWAAAHRLRESGRELVLLFTDTLIEDPDLYRFLEESSQQLDSPLVRIADGRNPWEVFHDEGFIGNTRVDLCSRILKRDLSRAWIDEQYPGGAEVVVGIDWSEVHRFERAAPRWTPHRLLAPLIDPPWLTKDELLSAARSEGLEPPRLYGMGFPHNNCGGFCVKQGQGGFARLLHVDRELYLSHEREEERFRRHTQKDVAILRDRRGGVTKPLTLRELRIRVESESCAVDEDDYGGCGCGF